MRKSVTDRLSVIMLSGRHFRLLKVLPSTNHVRFFGFSRRCIPLSPPVTPNIHEVVRQHQPKQHTAAVLLRDCVIARERDGARGSSTRLVQEGRLRLADVPAIIAQDARKTSSKSLLSDYSNRRDEFSTWLWPLSFAGLGM